MGNKKKTKKSRKDRRAKKALKKNSKLKQGIALFVIGACAAVFLAVSFYLIFSGKTSYSELPSSQNTQNENININFLNKSDSQESATNSEVATEEVNSNIENSNTGQTPPFEIDSNSIYYYNSKHGFQMVFPISWKDYIASDREIDLKEIGAVDGLDFGFQNFPNIFTLYFFSPDQWDGIAKNSEVRIQYLGSTETERIGYEVTGEVLSDEMQIFMNDTKSIFLSFSSLGNALPAPLLPQESANDENSNTAFQMDFENETISFPNPKNWNTSTQDLKSVKRIILSPYSIQPGEFRVDSDMYFDMYSSFRDMPDWRDGELFEDYLSRYSVIEKGDMTPISVSGCAAYEVKRADGILWREMYARCSGPVYVLRMNNALEDDSVFRLVSQGLSIVKKSE